MLADRLETPIWQWLEEEFDLVFIKFSRDVRYALVGNYWFGFILGVLLQSSGGQLLVQDKQLWKWFRGHFEELSDDDMFVVGGAFGGMSHWNFPDLFGERFPDILRECATSASGGQMWEFFSL